MGANYGDSLGFECYGHSNDDFRNKRACILLSESNVDVRRLDQESRALLRRDCPLGRLVKIFERPAGQQFAPFQRLLESAIADGERRSLAELGKRLGKQALDEVASIVNPDTILGWHRRLVAKKFDGSKNRQYPGRPRVDAAIEELVVRLAKENKSWGYDRIAGALANLGHEVADQTIGNILKRHGIPLAPERRKTTSWREFIRSHMDVLAATDFFTTEVWTQGGLVTYYVVFFIHLATRRVHVAGITPHPNEQWMTQVARNVTMADVGFLSSSRYLIHDRDSKLCESFHRTMDAVGVAPVKLPARDLDTRSVMRLKQQRPVDRDAPATLCADTIRKCG